MGPDIAPAFIGVGLRDNRIALMTAPVADALAHHAAVVDAARRGPLLPARFGAAVPDAAQLLAREQEIMAALACAGDAVEIAVGLTAKRVPPAPQDDGRAYMLAARESEDRRRQLSVLADLMAGWDGVLDSRRLDRGDGGIRLSLCARRRDAMRLADEVEVIAIAQAAAITVTTSGPWPIYSFGVEAVLETGTDA